MPWLLQHMILQVPQKDRVRKRWKGKQVKVLYELVTVNGEYVSREMPLSDREGGCRMKICESGDLPAELSGRAPDHE